MEAVKIENVTKAYKSKTAVDNISFSIQSGQIVGVVEVNGISIGIIYLIRKASTV